MQNRIEKEISQLEDNPFVGKPLGYKFFREKRVDKFRIYFLCPRTESSLGIQTSRIFNP
ncbi:hypothetical protein HYZ97_02100 [Candidatus Pacearchaeota archaeon]|nr:hypothetical protein [Candidatus Pacearchaeota archaeon]